VTEAPSLKLKYLVAGVAASVLLAVIAVVAIVLVVAPASPTVAQEHRALATTPGPAGLTAGTTPTATNTVWVTAWQPQHSLAELLSLSTGRVLNRIICQGPDGTKDDLSATVVGTTSSLLVIGLTNHHATRTWTNVLAFYDAATGALRGYATLPDGTIRDLNTTASGADVHVLITAGSRAADVVVDATTVLTSTAPLTIEPTTTVTLPAATIGMVLTNDNARIYALERDGRVDIVQRRSGQVTGTITVDAASSRIGISNDGTVLYLLVPGANGGHDRVDLYRANVGEFTISMDAPPHTHWILPTANGERMVDFAGTSTSGTIAQYRMLG
jgi:hypothetical protein